MSKIMQVFYGNDCLPYKDSERSVHYPIVGNSFTGSSLVDEIRFYIDRIGDISDNTFVSVSKRADGKVAYEELEKNEDEVLGENYVSLYLSSWYTQKKGDLYITLNVYQGGVNISVDSESGLYTVSGTPIIQATGSIKIAINYATLMNESYGAIPEISVQEALALYTSKLDINSPNYVRTIDTISNYEWGVNYNVGDIIVDRSTRLAYQINSSHNVEYIDLGNIRVHEILSTNTFDELYALLGEIPQIVKTSDTNTNQRYVVRLKKSTLGTGEVKHYYILNIGDVELQRYKSSGFGISGSTTFAQMLDTPEVFATEDEIITLQNTKENVSNKVTSLSESSTNTQYPSAKCVYDNLQNVREVAEGKCKSITIDYSTTLSQVKSGLSEEVCLARKFNPTTKEFDIDIGSDILADEYDDIVVFNASFNNQNTYIYGNNESNIYLIFGESRIDLQKYVYYFIEADDFADYFNKGDIVIVRETDVPDRWFDLNDPPRFYVLETTKVDLTNVYKKNENLVPTVGGSYSVGNNSYRYTTVYLRDSLNIFNHGVGSTVYWELYEDSSNNLIIRSSTDNTTWTNRFWFDSSGSLHTRQIVPIGNDYNLGSSSFMWQDLYVSRYLSDNMYSYTIAETYKVLFNYSRALGGTTILWSEFLTFTLTSNTVFTFETPKTSCLNEYKAIITNGGSSSITLTFPSGVKILTNDEDNVVISDNIITLSGNTTIEISCLNSCMVAINFGA